MNQKPIRDALVTGAPTGSGVIVEDKHATAVRALQDARAASDRATAAMY